MDDSLIEKVFRFRSAGRLVFLDGVSKRSATSDLHWRSKLTQQAVKKCEWSAARIAVDRKLSKLGIVKFNNVDLELLATFSRLLMAR